MSDICPAGTFFDDEASHGLPNNNCTLVKQCDTLCCMNWIFLFSFIVIYGISRSFIAFRQLKEITEDISERIEDEARPTPFIAMVDIQEAEAVDLRENDAMVDDTRRAAISHL